MPQKGRAPSRAGESLDTRVLAVMQRHAGQGKASIVVKTIMKELTLNTGEDSVAVLGAALRVQDQARASK